MISVDASPQRGSSAVASHARDATVASLGSPLLGVSSAGFAAVVAAAGGRAALQGKTAEWLKHAFVLPATVATAAPYADLLEAQTSGAEPPVVGRATAFLSHSYDGDFLDAVDAVTAWEAEADKAGGPHYFYFDLFVVNQHQQSSVVDFETLRTEFGRGVEGTGAFLFLLDHAAPRSLTRSWCVFEAATALSCGTSFDVVMPPAKRASLSEALIRDHEALWASLAAVDVAAARAREPADARNIARMIEEEMGGFGRINTLVSGAMRAWMLRAGRAVLAAIEPPAARPLSPLQLALARFLLAVEQRGEALALAAEAEDACRAALGPAHESVFEVRVCV